MTTPAAVIVDAAAYYAGGTSVLDDDAYDRLVRGIAAWEAEHPDQVLPESPTGKVAGGAMEGDVPHTVAMLSLDNVFSPEEFTAWTASLARRIGHEVERFSAEPKLMNELIERAGGRSSSSVSKKTTLVVAGDGAGSKRAKAETLGISLATPDEFAAVVADFAD